VADVAKRLISKIVAEGDFTPALSGGIKENWFEDEEPRRVYIWMVDYYNRYNKTPTADALHLEFPTYKLLDVEEPYQFYVDRFRATRERTLLVDGEIDLHEALEDGDLKLAKDRMSQTLSRVGSEVSSLNDLVATTEWRSRYDEYDEMRMHSDEMTGIPTGFETFDHLTGGFHDEQFILFAGQAKAGKSWLMMKSAVAAQEAGKKVLFITFEMSLKEQMARYDGITCGINSNKLLRNKLDDNDMKLLRRGMKAQENRDGLFICSADITATTTPSGLSGKIDEHRPDIVFVDGIYLMENEAGHQPGTASAYTSLSRSMKRLAQRVKIPLVGTMQALSGKMDKTGKVTLHSLGWSSSWSQDADLVIGAERDETAPLIKLRIVAGRNVSPAETFIACGWEESSFEETECIEEPDEP
jgi:hypothetical protein